RLLPENPRHQRDVRHVQQCLEPGKFRLAHPPDFLLGKTAQHEVHLAHAAMPGAIERPATAHVQPGAASRKSRHRGSASLCMVADIETPTAEVSLASRGFAHNLRRCARSCSIPCSQTPLRLPGSASAWPNSFAAWSRSTPVRGNCASPICCSCCRTAWSTAARSEERRVGK